MLRDLTADAQIKAVYQQMKADALKAAQAGNAEGCMAQAFDLWMFMNRFRNCDLRFYFDEDLHDAISSLNSKRFDTSTRLRQKHEYRLAFIIGNLIDTGGASVPHRFMLERYPAADITFRQYVLVSNIGNRTEYESTESSRYLKEEVGIEEFEHLPAGMSWLDKGRHIERWLYDREIDFVVVAPCPASLYAIASRPALVHAVLSQDCYTFTLGPGAGDATFLVTTDQVFKYDLRGDDPEKRMKIVMLPLHLSEYIESAVAIPRGELGVPEDAVVSGCTNMWKSCFGDSEILLEGIGELIRRYPNYHHVFAGTPRCLDNVEYFLSRNPDIRNNVHYVGPIKNIYRFLKSIDFWVNSFPTSGGSDIECALVGKPTIEFLANRNLDLHGAEFLRSRECDVVSLEEFVALGGRFITDPTYRDDLGRFLKTKIQREFDKNRIVKEKIYDFFLGEYHKRLAGTRDFPGIGLDETLEYEKRIGLYNAFGRKNWSDSEKSGFLDRCRADFPERPFAWIKSLEEAITAPDSAWFGQIAAKIGDALLKDHRVQILLAIGHDKFGQAERALAHAREAVALSRYDEVPARVFARLCAKLGRPEDAMDACKRIARLETETVTRQNVATLIAGLPEESLPLYYNY